jgi:hypothetical protein
MKNLVGINAVGADGDSFGPKLFNIAICVGNCRKFSRSNKSKVTGIKKD